MISRFSIGRVRTVHCAVVAALVPCAAAAQGVATDVQLEPVVVFGAASRSGLAPGLPGSTASKTAEDLREQNLVNPEDALKYLPGTSIRKRYIGDRNALLGGRSFGTLQPSRGLVYADGYLISNFLGRFDAPRWNMVTPEAIERVDVLYGPYSALYPGNSIGTTVAVTERTPRAFEVSVRATGYRQQFSEYGHSDHYDGNQLSAYLGSRLDSGVWYSATANHQNARSQPMNYQTVSADASGNFPTVAGTATPVTGVQYDTDPKGNRRAVFGASGGAVDHTVQDTLKFKLGHAFTPELVGQAMLGVWTNRTANSNEPFVRDASGQTAWSGVVSDANGDPSVHFSIPASAWAPSTRDELHRQQGITLKTRRASGWNGSVVYSGYRIESDVARQANSAQGPAGSVTRRDGTGWHTFEAQALYAPVAGDWGDGRHAVVFGLHRNGYLLDSPTTNAADWRNTETTLSQRYGGATAVTALYAQDVWKLRQDLALTLGLRDERFRAFDGEQVLRTASCNAGGAAACVDNGDGSFNRVLSYPERRLHGRSPKASLAWQAADGWLLKASFGRGVRFPNVEELYNGTVTAASETLSDPNLLPERSDAAELSAEHEGETHRLRASVFHDDVRDAILRQSTSDPSVCQTSATGASLYTCVQNVERVRTSGIEFAWQAEGWPLRGMSLDANLGLTRSKVVANSRDPMSVGKYWLRVPKVRANLIAAYRTGSRCMGSAGLRHSGRAYNDVYNADVHPDVYGGVSSFTFVDLRASCKLDPKLELALGVDNAADARGYQVHPYPGRTWFVEMRGSY